MNKISLIILLTATIICGCSGKKVPEPKINFDGSAHIKVIAENIIDSVNFEALFDSYFTKLTADRKVLIKREDTFILNIPMILPELADLIVNNKDSIKTYLIPGDTLEIKLAQEIVDSTNTCTKFHIDDDIFDFCQARYQYFGYHKILDGPARKKWLLKFCTSQDQFNALTKEADSVEARNISFLEKNSKDLPEWFVSLEKNNIKYIIAHCKLLFFQSLTNYSVKADQTFDVPLYNPDAKLSFEYYGFIDSYFCHGHPLDKNLTGTSRVIYILNDEFHKIDSVLKGVIKSVYETWILADLYNFCRSDEDANKIDTFIRSNTFTINAEGWKYIDQQKKIAFNKRVDINSLKPGDFAPDFELKDLKGKNHKLIDFIGKNIYLHFWATWCGPCIGEIPTLNQLISRTHDPNIVFINICIDNDYSKWKTIIGEKNLKGLNLICDEKWSKFITSHYKTSIIPHYTFIDEKGKIIKNNCARPGAVKNEFPEFFGKD